MQLGELGFANGDLRAGDFLLGLGGKLLGAEIAVVEFQQRLVLFHGVVHLDEDFGDEAGEGDADGDIFAKRLENAGGGDRVGEGFLRRHDRRITGRRHLLLGLGAGDEHDRDHAEQGGGDGAVAEEFGEEVHQGVEG